ncbi:MAG: glycosylase [Planctomycetes bacterium]|nr:glycosylase [Planctomycetota bacterium]
MPWRVILAIVAVFVALDTGRTIARDLFPVELVEFPPAEPDLPIFAAAEAPAWDQRIRERGWILFDRHAPSGQQAWRLWYTGYDGTPTGLRRLGLATSNDGLHWTRHPANPLSGEHWVEDMTIVPHSGTLHMFAEGRDDQAHLLTSTDGIHWTRVGPLDVRMSDGSPIAAGPYGTPTVWLEDGIWNLFYERRDAGIWLARSTDLKVWRNVQDVAVIEPGPAEYDRDLVAMNQVIRYAGRYFAYYHGSKSGSRLWSTAIATSTDLVHWTKYEGNPLRPVQENKSSGIVVHDGQRFRLYTMHHQVHVHLGKPVEFDRP